MRISHFTGGFLGLKKLSDAEQKNIAEWGFLLSAFFIVPLFFLPHASELVKIGLQLLWGACVSRAAFMANATWKKNSSR
ncbi:hypothetical protein BB778_04670 [Pluralibacter gergoviae]|uniref:hypothetical protein n=1 Tax=Pluralibacter gergoviae TaxID=61647 RepID=UPI0008DC137F|nr:hypothetical protein [Pluralibacter gergoviae]OHY61887.1 hypothetical protein BB778_04670 [Pluralibacter gergoviae]